MDNVTRPSMEDIQKRFQNFTIGDYVIFSGMLLGCSAVGLFYALRRKTAKTSSEADEYLMGGRNMPVFPISMSLISSFISGITLLGTPTEVYTYGTEYLATIVGFALSAVLGSYMVLPVFHELKLSSTYEYLQLRYDNKVRIMGSSLFSLGLICWLPIVIYVPALAFNQVTGVNVHIVTPLVCIVCIFYTCVGGLRGVVWTDVIQTFLMVGAIVVIMVKGTYHVGGFQEVWKRNWESGRIEIASFQPDLTIRHSVYAICMGGTVQWLQNAFIDQNMIQRYLTLPSIKQARISICIFVIGCNLFVLTCGYCGALAYAMYNDCDPLTTGLAKAKDQLLPLLVMQVLGDFPGMPGLFVAGVFSAALSSLSTGLNSMSAVVLEDFVKSLRKTALSETATRYILRSVVVIFGAICVGLVFLVEKLGSVLQLTLGLSAVTSGPTCGIFVGGMLLPWLNASGAFWGGLVGLIFSGVCVFGSQTAMAVGAIVHPMKNFSTEGCQYTFTPSVVSLVNSTLLPSASADSVFPLYRLSYLWYTLLGATVTAIAASIISYATGGNDYKSMDVRIFSPFIRRWVCKKQTVLKSPEQKELLEIPLKL